MIPDKYISISRARSLTDFEWTADAMRKWIERGTARGIKIRGKWFIHKDDLTKPENPE